MKTPGHSPHDRTPTLVVQRISVLWWKSARGGVGAIARNALPLALPLGLTDAPEPSGAGFFYEGHAFSQERTTRADSPTQYEHRRDAPQWLATPPKESFGLHFASQGDALLARLSSPLGRPSRPASPRVAIPHAGFLRFITNGRHAGYGGTSYSREIYNVGFFRNPTAACFASREPVTLWDLQADLF